jgi:hypothetical protein
MNREGPEIKEAINMGVEKLLRKKDVAEVLCCSLRTVDRLSSLGLLTKVRLLGGIRYRSSQVQSILTGGAS